jgi:hypothetical protein
MPLVVVMVELTTIIETLGENTMNNFDMNDLIKLDFTKEEWTTLWHIEISPEHPEYTDGFKEEQVAIQTYMLPQEAKEYIHNKKLYVSAPDSTSYCGRYGDKYFSIFEKPELIHDYTGIKLVACQDFETRDDSILHINPDLIFDLGLKETEKGLWVKPDEKENPIIKVQVSDWIKPSKVEIKTTHLREYLSARELCLYLHMYYEKTHIETSKKDNTPNENNVQIGDDYRLEYIEYPSITKTNETLTSKKNVLSFYKWIES